MEQYKANCKWRWIDNSFHSLNGTLVPGDENNHEDVFIFDVETEQIIRA